MSETPPSDGSSPPDDAPVETLHSSTAGDGRRGNPVGFRYAVLGTELAAYTLTFAGIGYAIDRARGHQKLYATAAGTLVGFVYGMYRFVSEIQRGSGFKQ